MAKNIDLTPEVVNVTGYAGDDLPIKVTFPAGFADGRTWRAQVRDERADAAVVAEFTVTPGATVDDPVTLMLDAATTATMGGFDGVWDLQIGPNPTQTVLHGRILIAGDVTR